MRKKGDALSKAWETINTPLIAADSAMKDQADEEQKERKSLLLAIKRNSRERQARHIAKGMPIKSAQSKENTMSRIRGQSKTHTTGSIAREKQATHAHISKLMDDLPKNKPSKGITVTKKTVSMTPVSKTTKVKKPVTLCGLKKKAGINLFHKYREKQAAQKSFMLKIAADPNLTPREKLASAGLIARALGAGAKALPGLMRGTGKLAGKGLEGAGIAMQRGGRAVQAAPGLAGMRGAGQAVSGAGKLAGKGLEAAGKGVQSAGRGVQSAGKGVGLRGGRKLPSGGYAKVGIQSPAQRFASEVGMGVQGAGNAMQAGGRAVQAAPGVAGLAGLAGIAAGRMSKGQPQQSSEGGGGGQDAYQGMSPYGTGLTGRPRPQSEMQMGGRSGLHSGLSQLFGNTEQNMPPGVMSS